MKATCLHPEPPPFIQFDYFRYRAEIVMTDKRARERERESSKDKIRNTQNNKILCMLCSIESNLLIVLSLIELSFKFHSNKREFFFSFDLNLKFLICLNHFHFSISLPAAIEN